MVIVLNCSGCGKRYEVDGSLAGKKSRCKQCGEVFPIPVPSGRPVETQSLSKPGGPGSARPTASQWESIVDSGGSATPEQSLRRGRSASHIAIPECNHNDRAELPEVPKAVRGRWYSGGEEIAVQGLRRGF